MDFAIGLFSIRFYALTPSSGWNTVGSMLRERLGVGLDADGRPKLFHYDLNVLNAIERLTSE